jgi:riboflavin synthase
MFTGIVEELGTVLAVEAHPDGADLRIGAERVLADAHLGASIAVDGCCLTVTGLGPGWWEARAVAETLRRTTLADRRPGDPVNLERPVAVGDRLGGHVVLGHVDGTATVVERVEHPDGGAELTFHLDEGSLARYVVEKGSVALDGVSLTVAGVHGADLRIALIPHTASVTTLGKRRPGQRCNVEVDVLAKHVERLLGAERVR